MASAESCLSCFAIISASDLPRSIVHSCCSRPVCSSCLHLMPRLATFCPFCEGVDHAFRKGPRRDVVRAGQVVFDMDSAMISEKNELQPPAYEEQAETCQQQQGFVLESDEEGDDQKSQQRTPHLLQTSRLGVKQEAAVSAIDRSNSVTISSSPTSTSSPASADCLRQSLSRHGGDKSDGPTGESSRAPCQDPQPSGMEAVVQANKPRKNMSPDASGLTRQYWLRPNDTLMSLCLRFKVNAATLCKLNDLPLSTANTTPHLVHTRQFLLIPERAIQSALSSSNGNVDLLQSALDGPTAQSRKQKVQRARREAQGKFRALIAKNEGAGKGKARAEYGDVTLCDDRAAKAYISLMEEELRCIDFGDGLQKLSSEDVVKEEEEEGEEVEENDAALDAARRERFNVIVRQAVCRWEMDSDWERRQRAMGITPIEAITSLPTLAQPMSSSGGRRDNWFKRITAPSRNEASRVGWMEKAR